jgi:hypothetical protein
VSTSPLPIKIVELDPFQKQKFVKKLLLGDAMALYCICVVKYITDGIFKKGKRL